MAGPCRTYAAGVRHAWRALPGDKESGTGPGYDVSIYRAGVEKVRGLGALAYLVIGISFFDTMSQLPVVAPFARSLGAGTALAGFTVAAYSVSNLLGNVAGGPLIDRWGRKGAMAGGLAAAAGGILLGAFSVSPWHYVAARLVHGLGAAVLVPAAFAYVGDRSADETDAGDDGGDDSGGEGGAAPGRRTSAPGRRTSAPAMARSGIAIGLAALIGPPFGGIVRDRLGFDAVFITVSALLALAALLVWALLPEKRAHDDHAGGGVQRSLSVRDFSVYRALLGAPTYAGACVAAFLLTFGKGILAFALPLRAIDLGYGSAQAGALLSAFAISALGVFAVTRRLERFPLEARVLSGLPVIAVALALLSVVTPYWALAAVMLVYGLGFGVLFPAAAAQVVAATTKAERGRAFGLFYGFFSLGVVAGPVLGGLLEDAFGLSPFWTAAAVLAVGVPVVRLVYRSSAPARSRSEHR